MIINLLKFYDTIYTFTYPYWLIAKQYARDWLGPTPLNYYLLNDEQVVPTTVKIPESLLESAYIYEPDTCRIVLAKNMAPEGRFRPLSYLGARIEDDPIESIDITDWLGCIRVNPAPSKPFSVLQLVNLWSQVHHTYVPLNGRARMIFTNDDGMEVTI